MMGRIWKFASSTMRASRPGVTCLDCLFDLGYEGVAPRRAVTHNGHVVWTS